MSLNVCLNGEEYEVLETCHCCGESRSVLISDEFYWANITHNLGVMAGKAGIYEAVWRPDGNGFTKAGEIIQVLESGLEDMKKRPDYYRQFDASNGWGTYRDFVPWLEKYLEACKEYPEACIRVSR
jgi:hypothetical protein